MLTFQALLPQSAYSSNGGGRHVLDSRPQQTIQNQLGDRSPVHALLPRPLLLFRRAHTGP